MSAVDWGADLFGAGEGGAAASADWQPPQTGAQPIGAVDWPASAAALDAEGYAVLPGLLPPEVCRALAAGFDEAGLYRSRVVMQRHGFGRGEYKYFADPLPPVVAALRSGLYPPLAALANAWQARLARGATPTPFPATHAAFRAMCAEAGQTRPTPLLLRYGPGDYNCLHQDLYGELVFPIQVAILLDRPGEDFTGGEFVIVEQRPRAQSRPHVVPLRQGDAVAFAVSHRPVAGVRGDYRVTLRHGVSALRSGQRHTLGVIFHDAR